MFQLNRNDFDDDFKNRPALSPSYCVSKWSYDKQMDEGFIYQMSDYTYGMLCADGLKLMLTPDEYVPMIVIIYLFINFIYKYLILLFKY